MKNRLLKQLASETAVYGITHTLGRLINFLLVPIYTGVFKPEEYGVVSVYYSLVAFLIVVLMYGMETAFFNFTRSDNPKKVFATAQISLVVTSFLFLLLALTGQQSIANFLEYPDQTGYVRIFAFILVLDALSNLPMAWLRFQKKPLAFGAIRLVNIGVNVLLNLYFIIWCPKLVSMGYAPVFYNESIGIGYIFISNLVSSLVMFALLIPQWKLLREGFDSELWKRMWKYGKPLIIIGFAGIINETVDRILIKKIMTDNADFEVGVYSAFYKLSMLMTIFVQSFRFAAEPFFFEQSKGEDPKATYAKVMHYFVLVLSFIFLGTMVFLRQIAPIIIRREEYFNHPYAWYITPVLLMANLFLGIMYNLNIWYKLNDKMRIGMYIAAGGGLATIVLNLALIPVIGIMGSAITTLVVYFGMAVASYRLGQQHYRVPYNLKIIIFYIVLSQACYWFYALLAKGFPEVQFLWSVLALGLFVMMAYFIERPTKNRKFAG